MSERTKTPMIGGIHHVTAIASTPQPNLDFYIRFLGLRLVKKTVNFDDPGTYHLYYGDRTGQPGTIMTFFPWPGAARGRHGVGQVTLTSFAVPFGSLDYWKDRAAQFGYQATTEPERFGEAILRVYDQDGLGVELAASLPVAGGEGSGEIPGELAVRLIGSATLTEANPARTLALLTEAMGFRETGRDENR